MNFLAHIFLAGESEPLIIGNFIGDFVKGRLHKQYPQDIMRGIALHREIDHYTDNHLIVSSSKIRLRSRFRHYAGVLVDMFYDHLLAVHWNKYSPIKLEEFTESKYALLQKNFEILPEKVQYMLPHMIENNWLLNYRQMEGLERALKGMAQRTKFRSGMEMGSEELILHYNAFEEEFQNFFPQIISFVEDKKLTIKAS